MHSGDQQDGKSEGYDECITINLQKINFSVSYLAVLINSYQGVGFRKLESAYVNINQNNASLVTIMLG